MLPVWIPLAVLLPMALKQTETPECQAGDPSIESYASLGEPERTAIVDDYLTGFEPSLKQALIHLRSGLKGTPLRVEGRLKSGDDFRAKILRAGYACFSQITDAAGVRIVVPDYAALPYVMQTVETRFEIVEKQYRLDDVERPGYRTVHYLTNVAGRIVEIQILTRRGVFWAQAARELYYDQGADESNLLEDYLWELSRTTYLLDSRIETPLPSVPSNLPRGARDELLRITAQLRAVGNRNPSVPEALTPDLPVDAKRFALDDFGGLRYEWQRAISSPRCLLARRRAETGDYLAIVTLYRQGDVEGAVERMRALHRSDFDKAIGILRSSDSRLTEGCLQAAALVHTEVAMREKKSLQWSKAATHLDAARKLIPSISSVAARDAFFKEWLLAMAWLHQSFIFTVNAKYGFTEAQEYLGEAVHQFPDDAEVLLAAGTLFEWAGSLRLGEAAHLERAEELYARSLLIEPKSVEANLRYGCVLEKRGKFDEARVALLNVLELPAGDIALYRALMTLGSLAERRERPQEAREYYERAIETRPDWQVAYIALGHCLHRLGARARSRRVLEAMFSLPRTERTENGWFRYELGLSERLELLIEKMRREVTF